MRAAENSRATAGAPVVGMDTDQVLDVADFYSRAGQVLGAVATDLSIRELGAWARGPSAPLAAAGAEAHDLDELARTYAAMGATVAARLSAQSAAADRLAAALRRGAMQMTDGDERAAVELSSPISGASVPR